MTGAEREDEEATASDVLHERFDWSSVSPSEAAVETVVAFAGRDHEEIEPLYATVDPDALDVLIAESAVEASVSVTLTLGEQEIHVRSGGDVVVSEAGT